MDTINPHNCATLADAYAAGVAASPAYLAGYSAPVALTIARNALAGWTSALSEHEHTSYYGTGNIQKSRAYFIGVMRGIRASDAYTARHVRRVWRQRNL